MYQFDHIGIIVDKPKKGMIYCPEIKVWTSDYEKNEHRIEWVYFEKESHVHPLILTKAHVGFVVKDLDKALKGKKILMAPVTLENCRLAFIEDDGVPVEFIEVKS